MDLVYSSAINLKCVFVTFALYSMHLSFMILLNIIDLRVGFERTLYSVSESEGELLIPVRVLADDDGITPEIGLPLGVRVTSRDDSAVGMA